jgi:hypothetical protein
MVEFVARHNISSGKKGERKTILAGQRFNPEDFPEISMDEWKAMHANGNIGVPNDPEYATASGMVAQQRTAAGQNVVEGRSGRDDIGERAPARTEGGVTRPVAVRDEDDDDDDDQRPARRRRARRAKPAGDDDDGDEI